MKKRILATLLCAITVAATLTGCGQRKETGNEKNGNETEITEGVGTSFSYTLPGKYLNWLKDLNYWKDIQEMSGITVELVNGGENDDSYYQNVDLSVGNGNLTDAIIVKQSQAAVYQAQGAFMDLTDLINEYGPNIKAYIEANPEYAAMMTTSDGAIYGIPAQNPLYTNLTFYRTDMLEEAGITALPTTIDEFTDIILGLDEILICIMQSVLSVLIRLMKMGLYMEYITAVLVMEQDMIFMQMDFEI